MSKKLFTMGYQMRTIDDFTELLVKARIDVLIDVRETAWSHKPGFSKAGLTKAMKDAGIEYVHAPFAGNPKKLRSTATTHSECLKRYRRHLDRNPDILRQFSEMVAAYDAAGKRVCLTCFERHPEDCHRGILAELWAKVTRATVDHLHPKGCSRLVPV